MNIGDHVRVTTNDVPYNAIVLSAADKSSTVDVRPLDDIDWDAALNYEVGMGNMIYSQAYAAHTGSKRTITVASDRLTKVWDDDTIASEIADEINDEIRTLIIDRFQLGVDTDYNDLDELYAKVVKFL